MILRWVSSLVLRVVEWSPSYFGIFLLWGSGCRWLFPKGVNFALFLSYFYSEARNGASGGSVVGCAYVSSGAGWWRMGV